MEPRVTLSEAPHHRGVTMSVDLSFHMMVSDRVLNDPAYASDALSLAKSRACMQIEKAYFAEMQRRTDREVIGG